MINDRYEINNEWARAKVAALKAELCDNIISEAKRVYFVAIADDFFGQLYKSVVRSHGANESLSHRTRTLLSIIDEFETLLTDNPWRHQAYHVIDIHNALKKAVQKKLQDPRVQKLDLQKVLMRGLGVLICMTVIGNLVWLFNKPRAVFWNNSAITSGIRSPIRQLEKNVDPEVFVRQR